MLEGDATPNLTQWLLRALEKHSDGGQYETGYRRALYDLLNQFSLLQPNGLPSECWEVDTTGALPVLCHYKVIEGRWDPFGALLEVRIENQKLDLCEWRFAEDPALLFNVYDARAALEKVYQKLHPNELPCDGCTHMVDCDPGWMVMNRWQDPCPRKQNRKAPIETR